MCNRPRPARRCLRGSARTLAPRFRDATSPTYCGAGLQHRSRAPARRSGPARRRRASRPRRRRPSSTALEPSSVAIVTPDAAASGSTSAARRLDDAHDVVAHGAAPAAPARSATGVVPDDDEPAGRGRGVRRTRPRRPPRRTSSARPRVRGPTALASPASGRIDTSARVPCAIASSACWRTISREHAPPTKPSMRPSANTMARSPRCADTGARRARPWRRRTAVPRAAARPPARRRRRWHQRQIRVTLRAASNPATALPAPAVAPSRPASWPWNSSATSCGRPHVAARGFSNSAVRAARTLASSRHAASRARRSRYAHWNRSSGSSPATNAASSAPIGVERDDVRVAHGLARCRRQRCSQTLEASGSS